ncbi:DUF2628 domain-containing protein [Chelatococcus sp. SYSU_G07232]|uniref:DUF2628 domain-containing protein n=1 Tax=Chelatococcus albus TaxID=3047466 RepID=A0ABT7AH85_9HYPH|nr:DUF2628 domain-containing protein [Chelatococcus sp. SYSU_G07232]MDJ1158733.1 DUF2628 domain-containing protein [Chelatococcus sp. SYSU_G07232]
MAVYTFHMPVAARPGDPHALDAAVLVRDGFSWGAFAFSVLWFLWHRLWLGALGVLAAAFVLTAIGRLIDLPGTAATLAGLLFGIAVALEANSVRRWTLQRRGLPVVDAVFADDLEGAEARAFTRWLRRTPEEAPATATPLPPTRHPTVPASVVGLFPEAEGGR